jgi:hypothetical protein
MSTRRAFTSLALLLATSTGAAACAGSDDPDAPSAAALPPRADDGPKANPVSTTPDQSQITEALGVFVAIDGQASNDGTRARPLDTIKAGVELGKRTGKRVYVSAGTYREAVVIADSISIIGGLVRNGAEWKLGPVHTRIEAPSSPAVRAKDIASATRIEGLDVVAPDATAASGSSIGVFADQSAGIVIANSKIIAGNGSNGADGVEGIQLTQTQTGPAKGADTLVARECVDGSTCTLQAVLAITPWVKPAGGAGGTSICAGAPGHNGFPGGNGGSGGLFQPDPQAGSSTWHVYGYLQANAPELGQDRPRTAAANGVDGANPPGPALGTLSADGYVPRDGAAGTHGTGGNGGYGGRGDSPPILLTAHSVNEVWRGNGGPGGGAGGCPGLAGAPGGGGGASIAVALLSSPITFDGVVIVAGNGGAGGHGTFGSSPLAGGDPGSNNGRDPSLAARAGGNGGYAGISTNGSSGPSMGIAQAGPAPHVSENTKITVGQPGPAIEARQKTQLGILRTIPATPAGSSGTIVGL